MSAIGSLLRGLLTLASWLVAIVLVMKFFFVDVIEVPHNGMAPTLIKGDRVLVWRRAHVDMADIVVCQHPANPAASVLGRAIAFAGHTVSSDAGNLVVDDDRANIEWQRDLRFYDTTRDKLFSMRLGSINYVRQNQHAFMVEDGTNFELQPYQVEHGVYLLGDNRADPADDSREFGEVDPATCRGQVFMRLTPAPRQDDDIHHGYLDVIH
jgi:signal peptidase I